MTCMLKDVWTIAHSRRHLSSRASSFYFLPPSSCHSGPQAWGYLRLRRPGQPSSSSPARRACVHFDFVFLKRCGTPWFAVVRSSRVRADGGVCRLLFAENALLWSRYSASPLSSRPEPLGSRREAAPCEDTREDFGLSI